MSGSSRHGSSRVHPIDVLESEHEVILSVLEAMDHRAVDLQDGANVTGGFWILAADFMAAFADRWHEAKEELVLFPAIRSSGAREMLGPLAVMRHEHIEGRALCERLRVNACTGGAREVLNASRRLSCLMREHFEKEQRIVFDAARRLLDEREITAIRRGFVRLEARLDGETGRDRCLDRARRICAATGVTFPDPRGA